jgi:L-iditol 2-dehydrogenase
MKAVRLFSPGDLRLAEIDPPEPGPAEVLVRVEAAGICGTDRHLFKGEFPCTPPVTLCHEFSGIVAAAGAGAGIAPGTRVTVDPNIACGTCGFCRAGRPNLCQGNIAIGLSRDGGFAPFAAVPAHRAIPLPADLDPLAGALAEPLACTLHGIDIGAPKPGERVIVIGGGVIGLLAMELCIAAGADVLLLTRNLRKRALAEDLGAQATAPTPEGALTHWPEGADLVVECAGVAETVAMSPRLTRTGGRIVLLGVLPKGLAVPFEPFDLLVREISLLPAFINPFTQTRAAAMIASGRVRVAPLITRVVGLEEVAALVARDPDPADVKVVAVPA